MKTWVVLLVLASTLAGCVGKTVYRGNCADQPDVAWEEFNLAKVEGFAGTVNYLKTLTLLTGAKIQQQSEAYEGYISKAEKACFYVREPHAGCRAGRGDRASDGGAGSTRIGTFPTSTGICR